MGFRDGERGRVPCVRWIAVLMISCTGALSWWSLNPVAALPVPGPDLWHCRMVEQGPTDGQGTLLPVDCCIPTDVPIVDFEFPDLSEPIKYRKNSASLDSESIEKLNLAYTRMRALPRTDPRSMVVQQNIHCGYCTEGFIQLNSNQTLEIHRNWLLLPFHRMYVYFHERILGSLIDDPTFAIPYWNWDNQSSVHSPLPNAIPEYMVTKPALNDPNRDPQHLAPTIADLHWGEYQPPEDLVPPGTPVDVVRHLNNVLMHTTVVSGATLSELFLGVDYHFDDDLPWGASGFEILPHASIHEWVGKFRTDLNMGEDMSPAYAAARDPLFFLHHSNVDRLFEAWRALGGRRTLPEDPDWLDAAFLFYNENGEMVRVTVRQSLEIERLRYSFEPSENGWLEDPSVPLSSPESSRPGQSYWIAKAVGSAVSSLGFSSAPVEQLLSDIPDVESIRAPRFSSSTFRARVSRPHAALRAAGKVDELEEVLVIDRIWVPSKAPVWFNIFMNLPEADESTPLYATEWCGRFSNGPHLSEAGKMEKGAVFKVSIGEKLKKLGIVGESSVVVSLVPMGAWKHQREVQIRTISIHLQ